MKISALISELQTALLERGDVEVKLDIDGCDCDPDIAWFERKRVLYLW